MNRRIYEIDLDFFNKIDLETCSLAGLLAADGCITPKKKRIHIALNRKDRPILETWRGKVNYSGPIGDYEHDTTNGHAQISMLHITGVPQWLKVLEEVYNVTPNKSQTLKPPNLTEKEHIQAFMSGYIDGDGSIMKKEKTDNRWKNPYTYIKWEVDVAGTLMMLEWFKKNIDEWYPPKKPYSGIDKRPHKNVYQFRFAGKRALQFIEDLYKLPIPRLARKWDPAIEYIREQQKRDG